MPDTITETLARRPIVLDGGLATQLEARGHDLSSSLWSARLLLEQPEEVQAAHADFFAAGAEVATTASYQVSYDGFVRAGMTEADADEAIRASTALARAAAEEVRAAGRPAWVAASVGPYGAALADGSEYTGRYDLDEDGLRTWHERRLAAIVATGPDLLALETVPNAAEARALLALVAGTGVPTWLSLSAEGATTRLGEPLDGVYAAAAAVPEVVAVGVNCVPAADATAMVDIAVRASGLSAVVYPNSGEGWDAEARGWTGTSQFSGAAAAEWVSHGARLVGGCCRVTPTDIRGMAGAIATG
ncbi:homocysteine S-methyltransferase [Actinomycetota bacterium]